VTNTLEVYSHCNAPWHQSTACTIQFFDTLLNIQLFSNSVATTTQVHQHFKQGISHSGTIWPHDETSLGKQDAKTKTKTKTRALKTKTKTKTSTFKTKTKTLKNMS